MIGNSQLRDDRFGEVGFRVVEWLASVDVSPIQKGEFSKVPMIYPDVIGVDDPNDDMRNDVKECYRNAMKAYGHGLHDAAAMYLRKATEGLLDQIGVKAGKTLMSRINDFHEHHPHGKSKWAKRVMDNIRVVGNDSVHFGDSRFDKETISRLFWALNFIVRNIITDEKAIEEHSQSVEKQKDTGRSDSA